MCTSLLAVPFGKPLMESASRPRPHQRESALRGRTHIASFQPKRERMDFLLLFLEIYDIYR